MSIIEDIRKTVINDLFETSTVKKYWPAWARKISRKIGASPNPQSILDIGDNLSDIFKSTRKPGRGQRSVSAGGAGWEALIVWYINLCTVGSRVVAVKKASTLPSPIKDAITVYYSNFACSSESDITIIVFPDEPHFTKDNASLYTDEGSINKTTLNSLVGSYFSQFEIGIIQCKTNWNDNAQIPMLWDMIYSMHQIRRGSGGIITVGINNFNLYSLKGFTYSFVTVPTNKMSSFKTTSVCVERVKSLSGGNYWGYPSSNGIARSLKEIFNNYLSGFINNDIRKSLQSAIIRLNDEYSYFRISSRNKKRV